LKQNGGWEDYSIRSGSSIKCKECEGSFKSYYEFDSHSFKIHGRTTLSGMGQREPNGKT